MIKHIVTLLWFILLAYLAILTTTTYFNGFPDDPNEWMKFALLILAGKLLIVIVGVISVVAALWAMAKGNRIWTWAAFLALTTGVLFVVIWPLARTLYFSGVRNDLLKKDVAAIRREVAEVLTRPHTDNLDGYFGELLTSNMVPPNLRSLSTQEMFVRTTDGVVIRMDGLGSWRGGYLFLPPDGTCTWNQAELVMPGVFYVISK